MIKLLLTFLTLCTLLISCSGENHSASDTIDNCQSDSMLAEKDIYEFMNYLIEEKILDLDHRIERIPEKSFAYFKEVDTILYLLEIKDNAIHDSKKNDNDNYVIDSMSYQLNGETYYTQIKTPVVSISSPSNYPEIFTKEDSKIIKDQVNKNISFKWDNDRLQFLETSDFWYQISVPCFSKDKKHVIILVRSLCPGLCGGGDLYLFTKKGIKWEKQVLDAWFH